jgi:hypothetical protein
VGQIQLTAVVPVVKVIVGGDQHRGWLPATASRPLPTPQREIDFRIEIQSDGLGYLLCYESLDGSLHGDAWHETRAEAVDAAREDFGVRPQEWRQA